MRNEEAEKICLSSDASMNSACLCLGMRLARRTARNPRCYQDGATITRQPRYQNVITLSLLYWSLVEDVNASRARGTCDKISEDNVECFCSVLATKQSMMEVEVSDYASLALAWG